MADEVSEHLEPLIGLKLSIARRGADMRIFHFGDIQEVEGGTIGTYALHVQCPWRIDGPEGIITGRSDLWEHVSGKRVSDDWEPSIYDNIQDLRIKELLKGHDQSTRSFVNLRDDLVVERIESSPLGDATIYLSGGYQLRIFPHGTIGEHWRLLGPGENGPHFVVEGEEIYFMD